MSRPPTPDPTSLAGRADRWPEHRCPRCDRLLIRGRLPYQVMTRCHQCKRNVVVGGASRTEGNLA